ncbi:hypothetical protein Tco_1384290 [Tanacetum coccineum]
MSTPEYIYPIIILSDSDVEDTFSSTHSPDYIPALSDYSLASPGNTSPNFLDDLTKELLSSLSISLFHDDPYMKIIQAYDTIPPLQVIITSPAILTPSPVQRIENKAKTLLNNLHLIDLISLKEDLVYPVCAESLSLILSFHILNLVCYGNVFVVLRHEHVIQRISLTGFPAQSVWSSNTDVLDLPCLLVLITDTSQSRQHVDTSLIHRESCKSPTAVLFDDDTGRISIRHCEY